MHSNFKESSVENVHHKIKHRQHKKNLMKKKTHKKSITKKNFLLIRDKLFKILRKYTINLTDKSGWFLLFQNYLWN